MIKNRLIAYFTAWAVGGLTLVWRMIDLERVAEDSDFDLMFLFGLAIWVIVVGVYYAVIFVVASYIKKRMPGAGGETGQR